MAAARTASRIVTTASTVTIAATASAAAAAAAAMLARWALLLVLSFGGLAIAQSEATLDQVDQAAQAGRVEQALQMMQPVLKAHPDSGKAHFVEAELLARLGRAAEARAELATAERLAPGLPFAKADAVQHLQRAVGVSQGGALAGRHGAGAFERPGASPAWPGFGMPWGVVLALAGGALVAWLLMRLGRPASPPSSAVAAPGWAASAVAPGVPATNPVPAAYPGGMAQPAPAPGFGSRLAGGLATGLAAGAGLMAAEAICRNLFGGPAHAATQPSPGAAALGDGPVFGDTSANPDMGGNDFGIGDAGTWDDEAPDSSDWNL
jgi:hypothetical protein